MKQTHHDRDGGQDAGLGELLALGLKAAERWTVEELGAALAEQISTPVEFELSSFKPDAARSLRARAEAHGLVLKNLRELFQHPHPPLELLVMAKDYFKANSERPHPGLPAEVARALYYLALGVAWLRHHTRISSLTDAQIANALDWVRNQPWVNDELRALAVAAGKELRVEPPSAKP